MSATPVDLNESIQSPSFENLSLYAREDNIAGIAGSTNSAKLKANKPIASDSSTSGSETATEMSDRRQDKYYEGSSKGSSSKSSAKSSSKNSPASGSKSSSKSSIRSKTDNWSDVAEPEERRRIQNRIAQRKFREKTKETKEASERDARNQKGAGLAYTTPDPEYIDDEPELSGLPWGGFSLRHVVERGNARERESQQGSQGYGSQGYGSPTYTSPTYTSQTYYDYDYRYGGGGGGSPSGYGDDSQSR